MHDFLRERLKVAWLGRVRARAQVKVTRPGLAWAQVDARQERGVEAVEVRCDEFRRLAGAKRRLPLEPVALLLLAAVAAEL